MLDDILNTIAVGMMYGIYKKTTRQKKEINNS